MNKVLFLFYNNNNNNNNVGFAVFLTAHISLRRPHDLKAWKRLM